MKEQEHQYVVGCGYNFFYSLTDATIKIHSPRDEQEEKHFDENVDSDMSRTAAGVDNLKLQDEPEQQQQPEKHQQQPLHESYIEASTFPILPSSHLVVDPKVADLSSPVAATTASNCTSNLSFGLSSLLGHIYGKSTSEAICDVEYCSKIESISEDKQTGTDQEQVSEPTTGFPLPDNKQLPANILMNFPVSSKDRIKQVACGATHTAILTTTGEIYSIGCLYGTVHKLPAKVETRLPMKCISLAHGRRHVLALMQGESNVPVVVSWGAGHFGQLGHGNDVTGLHQPRVIERLLPQAIGGYRIISIAAGGLHSACIVDTGNSPSDNPKSTRVFAWGYNRRNQCGTQGGKCNTVSHPIPMADVEEDIDLASAEEGDTSDYEEKGSILHSRRTRRQRVSFIKLALGRLHTLGLSTTGNVFAWGCTSGGRCGLGEAYASGGGFSAKGVSTIFPKRVAALHKCGVVDIAVGDKHSLALTNKGAVYSWGHGSDGQLGHGHTLNLHTPRIIPQFSSSSTHSPPHLSFTMTSSSLMSRVPFIGALLSSGVSPACSVDGSSNNEKTPHDLASTTRGKNQDDPLKIVKIFANGSYSVALASNGDVYTWGYGDAGNLGHAVPNKSNSLPLIEPCSSGNVIIKDMKLFRDSCSFDSRLNVLMPRRLDLGDHMFVTDAALGPVHMILILKKRNHTRNSTSAQTDATKLTLESEQGSTRNGTSKKGSVELSADSTNVANSDKSIVDQTGPAISHTNKEESAIRNGVIVTVVPTKNHDKSNAPPSDIARRPSTSTHNSAGSSQPHRHNRIESVSSDLMDENDTGTSHRRRKSLSKSKLASAMKQAAKRLSGSASNLSKSLSHKSVGSEKSY